MPDIPANFTDAGRVMGMFELRNLVEAVILVLPVLYFCLVLLPLELTAKITVTLIIVVPLQQTAPAAPEIPVHIPDDGGTPEDRLFHRIGF